MLSVIQAKNTNITHQLQYIPKPLEDAGFSKSRKG